MSGARSRWYVPRVLLSVVLAACGSAYGGPPDESGIELVVDAAVADQILELRPAVRVPKRLNGHAMEYAVTVSSDSGGNAATVRQTGAVDAVGGQTARVGRVSVAHQPGARHVVDFEVNSNGKTLGRIQRVFASTQP